MRSLEGLQSLLDGYILTDLTTRQMYATDASVYEELPLAVAFPRNAGDCVRLVNFARYSEISLIPRTAGTSLAGQCVGKGVIVDFSRYMTRIINMDVAHVKTTVQPGVVLDDLNVALLAHGLKFAPDTSTSNRCMIGGMIGNNAAGAYSVLYGTTREHVIEVEAVLADGSLVSFVPISDEVLASKCHQPDMEGEIYRTMVGLVESHRDLILSRYPKPEIIRRNTGYALDYLGRCRPWNPEGPPFNLAPFLCGSEGTLAMVTRAVLNLTPVAKASLLVCVHFGSLDEAMYGVEPILDLHPAAVELMDRRILDLAAENIEQGRNRFWIDGDPEAVLVTEFIGGTDAEVRGMADRLIGALQGKGLGYAYPIIVGTDKSRVWDVRKAGLGLLMGLKGGKKPVTVIEDAAVSPRDLPGFVHDVRDMMRHYGVDCVYYGHASVGLLHLRPELDLADPADQEKFNAIAGDFAVLVQRYRGSLSGEHGDGRIRAPFLQQVLGEEVYGLLRQVKQLFDPEGIFNPGKILTDLPIDQGMRPARSTPPVVKATFDWSADLGMLAAAEKCNGAGACRKSAGRGTMCPSYQASGEERFSTRGRANLIRHALLTDNPSEAFGDPGLQRALEYCLGCKGCRSECPSNVDLARLKAEALHIYHQTASRSLRDRLLRAYPTLLRLASRFPVVSNRLMRSSFFRKAVGVHRVLPAVACQSMQASLQTHVSQPPGGAFDRKAILLCDIYTQYLEPGVGMAAVRVLEALGIEAVPLFLDHSPRLLISQGFLDEARACLRGLLHDVERLMGEGAELCVGLEPSELLTLQDEAVDLVGDDMRERALGVAAKVELFEGIILQAAKAPGFQADMFAGKAQRIAVHLHCHEKSLLGSEQTIEMLRMLVDGNVRHLETGCCGMAGHFGYSHPQMSHKIASQGLLPVVNAVPHDVAIIATGASCRAQIKELTGRRALHPAEILEMKLKYGG